MAEIKELRKRLDQAGQVEDPLVRRMLALAIITEGLSETRIRPIMVGGGAVAFYTLGGYTTQDIDVVMPAAPVVDRVMSDLGFEKSGRHWVRTDIDIVIEAPASTLHGDMDHVVEVDVDGVHAYVVGVEDLIIDRLCAFVHWESEEDGRWALRLISIHGETLDWDYLRRRAAEEKVADALAEMERIWREEREREAD
jgi:hypothetical protein